MSTNILPPTYVPGFHNEEAVRKMKYNPLGKTGLLVSHIGFGGGCLNKPLYGDFDDEEAIAAIHEAIKSGINYIDTAPWYGQGYSEKFLGQALKGIPREAYYLATKVGRYELEIENMFDFSINKTKQSFDKSLNLLGLPEVDIIQVHDIEFAPPGQVIKETLPTLEDFVRKGRAKFIGCSAYPLDILKETIEKSPTKISTILSYCRDTLIDDSLREFIPIFEGLGVGVIEAASPGMGLLTNVGPRDWHPASKETKDICARASTFCKEEGVEMGRLAVYHALTQPGPATHLIGMSNRGILKANLDLLYNGLSEKEKQVLAEIKDKYFSMLKDKHWEGKEIEQYWSEINALKGKGK